MGLSTLIYSDEKMDRLYRGALRVLRETGFWVDHEGLLKELEKRGMRVDRPRRRVSITEDLIDDLLAPSLDKGKGKEKNAPPFHPPGDCGIGGSFPKFYDAATRTSHPGTSERLIEIVRAFGSMPEFSAAGRALTLSDVPQEIEPIIATALVITRSPKPCAGEVYKAHNIPYLIELGEIATGRAGSTDYVASCTFVVPPLRLTRDEGDLIIEKTKRGVPAVAGTMPSSGATAPVTREGTVVIELAELIMIWLCARLIDPEIALGGIVASSSFDMRTATCCFSSPEAVIQDCATIQIARRYFGIDVAIATGYVDAKVPGIQTTYEKLYKSWWAMHFIGGCGFAPGLLGAGQAFCPAQALLDRDMWATVEALFRTPPEPPDEVPFEEIHRVATENQTFLDADHTRDLFRAVLHFPQFLDHTAREGDAAEAAKADGLLARPQARYEEAKRAAPDYRAPEDVCRAAERVVEGAKKALL